MRLEIDIPEHHYNNIMSIDSISLGRAPYKGIIMYAINAIKNGVVQEPRKGQWLDTEFKKLKECSICHARWGIYSVEEFDFCPSCGANMREVEE